MLTAKFTVIAPEWNRYNGQRSMVPPARSARQGACATIAGPEGESADFKRSARRLRPDIQGALHGSAFRLNLLLQERNGVDQLLGSWRATRNINIHWNDLVHALHQSVIIEHAT